MPDATARSKMSPDGGPPSHIQMTQNVFPMVWVHPVGNPTFKMQINEKDLKAKADRYVRTDPPAATRRKRVVPKFGKEARAELLTWERKRLRGMVEVRFIDDPAVDKTTLVDQILEVRKAYAAQE